MIELSATINRFSYPSCKTITIHVSVLPFEDDTVIVATPEDLAVTNPYDTVATEESELSHFRLLFVAFLGNTLASIVAFAPVSITNSV